MTIILETFGSLFRDFPDEAISALARNVEYSNLVSCYI